MANEYAATLMREDMFMTDGSGHKKPHVRPEIKYMGMDAAPFSVMLNLAEGGTRVNPKRDHYDQFEQFPLETVLESVGSETSSATTLTFTATGMVRVPCHAVNQRTREQIFLATAPNLSTGVATGVDRGASLGGEAYAINDGDRWDLMPTNVRDDGTFSDPITRNPDQFRIYLGTHQSSIGESMLAGPEHAQLYTAGTNIVRIKRLALEQWHMQWEKLLMLAEPDSNVQLTPFTASEGSMTQTAGLSYWAHRYNRFDINGQLTKEDLSMIHAILRKRVGGRWRLFMGTSLFNEAGMWERNSGSVHTTGKETNVQFKINSFESMVGMLKFYESGALNEGSELGETIFIVNQDAIGLAENGSESVEHRTMAIRGRYGETWTRHRTLGLHIDTRFCAGVLKGVTGFSNL